MKCQFYKKFLRCDKFPGFKISNFEFKIDKIWGLNFRIHLKNEWHPYIFNAFLCGIFHLIWQVSVQLLCGMKKKYEK